MRDKRTLCFYIVICCVVSTLFAEESIPDDDPGMIINVFVEKFVWYQKYLSLEVLPELYNLHDALTYAQSTDQELYKSMCEASVERVRSMGVLVFENLQDRIKWADAKIQELMERYGTDAELRALHEKHELFRKEVAADRRFPHDDACLDAIEEYYSRLITRTAYVESKYPDNSGGQGDITLDNPGDPGVVTPGNPGSQGGTPSDHSEDQGVTTPDEVTTYEEYIVKKGDYLIKIATNIYKDYRLWRRIYNANKDRLRYPNNPALIHPGIRLRIPR
jgi:hypothetical protein